ncbi:MAG TPA: DUF3667 domain-containing protein [Blastocatellia bacterium]|nr:DUF3667 domain-containing protein [Blastocatellia bacterium]
MAAHPETIEAHESTSQGGACLTCGSVLHGRYCHQCGQKRVDHHELSVKHFFGHFVHEITHLDSNKILRTLFALLFRPGLLPREYLSGRKGLYINPIRVYLTISALYFFFAWGTLVQMGGGGMERFESQRWFVNMAQQRGVEPHSLAEKIYQKAEKYSAMLRFASVIVSGLFLMVLYRKAKRYYVEHMVFSLYFYSFDFFVKSAYALILIGGSAAGLNLYTALRLPGYIILFVYLLYALHRVYQESWPRTAFKSVALYGFETALFFLVNAAGFIIAFSLA